MDDRVGETNKAIGKGVLGGWQVNGGIEEFHSRAAAFASRAVACFPHFLQWQPFMALLLLPFWRGGALVVRGFWA